MSSNPTFAIVRGNKVDNRLWLKFFFSLKDVVFDKLNSMKSSEIKKKN